MNIVIKETGKQETLSIINHENGVNYVSDFIGNYGALSDGQFTYDAELNAYRCDLATYDWWTKVVSDHQELEDRISELKEEYGSDRVQDVLAQVGGYDLEDLAAAINKELDEAFSGN